MFDLAPIMWTPRKEWNTFQRGGTDPSRYCPRSGITETKLTRRRKEYLADQGQAFPGKGRLKPDEEEIRRLKRRVADQEQERD